MADYNGVQAALIAADGQATRPMQAGSPLVFSDSYEFSSTVADKTVALFGQLPANLMITGINVVFDDLGTGVTIDIGDSADADRYVDGLDVATAAGDSQSLEITGMHYTIGTASGDNQVVLTVLDATATGSLKVSITGVL